MAKVVWTAEAKHWLRRSHDYIARDKPAAALGIVEYLYPPGGSGLERS